MHNLSIEHGACVNTRALHKWLARAGATGSGDRWIISARSSINLFHGSELTESRGYGLGSNILAEPATDFVIPRILTEPHRDARRSWRRVANMALVDGTWTNALSGLEYIPVASVRGNVLLYGPVPMSSGQHILAYLIRGELREAVGSKRLTPHARAVAERALLIEGAAEFWFCLGFLCGGLPLLPSFAQLLDSQFAESVLWSLLRFWPDIVALSPRFMVFDGCECEWPGWILVAQYLAPLIGAGQRELETIKKASPLAAGRILGRLLIRCYC